MNEGSVLITLKIVCPAESGKLFQTHPWKIREPSWMALRQKVQEVIPLRSATFRLSWWNQNHYEELRDDTNFAQAIEHWLMNAQDTPSIYVTLQNREPRKVYGRIPYDYLAAGSDNLETRRRSRLPWKLFSHKDKNRQSHMAYETSSSEAYVRSQILSQSEEFTGYPCGPNFIRNVPSRNTQPVPMFETVSPALNTSVNNGRQPQAVAQDNMEDGMQLAIETLRSMGFQHENSVLKRYITLSGGNLNEIIDLLQAHDFQGDRY
ncbi:hypothetical protein D915_000291 [Fasciola hepatica]|uniref:UBA domain-containing protein n=1 Tax=Fasciola hepatica TaxID=6192 RepID=A0A4E0S0F0_FASHE|nr:hypothetical protein D915_000291 [Fasciola hepatica]